MLLASVSSLSAHKQMANRLEPIHNSNKWPMCNSEAHFIWCACKIFECKIIDFNTLWLWIKLHAKVFELFNRIRLMKLLANTIKSKQNYAVWMFLGKMGSKSNLTEWIISSTRNSLSFFFQRWYFIRSYIFGTSTSNRCGCLTDQNVKEMNERSANNNSTAAHKWAHQLNTQSAISIQLNWRGLRADLISKAFQNTITFDTIEWINSITMEGLGDNVVIHHTLLGSVWRDCKQLRAHI